MKSIIELNEQAGQIIIRITDDDNQNNWYPAYTISQWVEQKDKLGHDITNKEYVRACCRQQIDERTGQIYQLPTGWAAAKHKSTARIYIYKDQPIATPQPHKPGLQIIPWDTVKVDDSLISCLRSYKYETILCGQPFKVEIIFYPDGLYSCRLHGNNMENKQSGQLGLAFVLAWQMELADVWLKNIDVEAEIKRRFYEFFHSIPDGQNLTDDFQKRCLWCGKYKPKDRKSGARFCQDKHRIYFTKWKKETISKYRTAVKREKFTPSEHAHNPWLPELLDHDLVSEAISDRLHKIRPNLT